MDFQIIYNGYTTTEISELRQEVQNRHFIVSVNEIIAEDFDHNGMLKIMQGDNVIFEQQIGRVQQIRDYINNRTTIVFYY